MSSKQILIILAKIFIVTPPKAGGTSMNGFARSCLGNAALFQQQLRLTNLRGELLTRSYDSPNLLVGHIFNEESMESLKVFRKIL